MAYIDGKSEIISHSVTDWQHQLQGDAIASKKEKDNIKKLVLVSVVLIADHLYLRSIGKKWHAGVSRGTKMVGKHSTYSIY